MKTYLLLAVVILLSIVVFSDWGGNGFMIGGVTTPAKLPSIPVSNSVNIPGEDCHACVTYCNKLNTSSCSVDKYNIPTCKCKPKFSGSKCDECGDPNMDPNEGCICPKPDSIDGRNCSYTMKCCGGNAAHCTWDKTDSKCLVTSASCSTHNASSECNAISKCTWCEDKCNSAISKCIDKSGSCLGPVNKCEVNPCKNNGSCTRTPDGCDYSCSCTSDYSGSNCTIRNYYKGTAFVDNDRTPQYCVTSTDCRNKQECDKFTKTCMPTCTIGETCYYANSLTKTLNPSNSTEGTCIGIDGIDGKGFCPYGPIGKDPGTTHNPDKSDCNKRLCNPGNVQCSEVNGSNNTGQLDSDNMCESIAYAQKDHNCKLLSDINAQNVMWCCTPKESNNKIVTIFD